MKYILLIFLMLTSCGPMVRSEHSLDGWRVIYNDYDSIESLCGIRAVGCADFENKVIYCEKLDFKTCGHELHHITDGTYHW